MNFIEASDRREVELLPACLDDYISEDSPARDIDSFVESLNLHDCGFSYPKSDSQGRGRPSYHPKHLLKLFIYGYMNGLRSGRKLENSCQINMEVLWLMQKLKPDFKTICDFRKNNSEAFKKVAAQYSLFCYQQGHIDGKLLAVDGSRIKGLSAASKSWSKSKAKRLLIHLEKETSKYLDILAKADDCPVESDEQRLKHIKHKLKHLEKRKEEIHTVQKEMAESGTDYISHSDKDTKILKKNGSVVVGYNAQTVVDSKNGLIICSEVTNKQNDLGLLAPMSKEAKELLCLDEALVVADKGYYSSEDLKECELNNITPHVPEVMISPSERKGFFGKRDFEYDPGEDVYICPAGQELKSPDTDKKQQSYRNRRACKDCPIKERCTAAKYRTIKRTENDEYLESNRERLKNNLSIRKKRKAIVEAPFSWLKLQALTGGFITKGFDMVRAEFSLAQLAFNMKRVTLIKDNSKGPYKSAIIAIHPLNSKNKGYNSLLKIA